MLTIKDFYEIKTCFTHGGELLSENRDKTLLYLKSIQDFEEPNTLRLIHHYFSYNNKLDFSGIVETAEINHLREVLIVNQEHVLNQFTNAIASDLLAQYNNAENPLKQLLENWPPCFDKTYDAAVGRVTPGFADNHKQYRNLLQNAIKERVDAHLHQFIEYAHHYRAYMTMLTVRTEIFLNIFCPETTPRRCCCRIFKSRDRVTSPHFIARLAACANDNFQAALKNTSTATKTIALLKALRDDSLHLSEQTLQTAQTQSEKYRSQIFDDGIFDDITSTKTITIRK